MEQPIINAVTERWSAFATYLTSITTAVGGFFNLNNIALLLGIFSTLVLFSVQYRREKNRQRMDRDEELRKEASELREKEFHEARMKALRDRASHVVSIDRAQSSQDRKCQY